MPDKFQILKATGQIEPFSEYKLAHNLNQAGLKKELEHQIIQQIQSKLKPQTSTTEIHQQIFNSLKQTDPASAARYNLRQAIMQLGPTGYPFEQYVARLLKAQNYQTQTNQIIHGHCISHEVDIVASKNDIRYMIECKYHNKRGTRSDVKTALYVWSRFQDIREAWQENKNIPEKSYQGWIVTNTKASTDAEDYAKCRGLTIISWYRPYRHSLKDMIVNTGLWPITCLSSLNTNDRKTLIKNNLVLCTDIINTHSKKLEKLKIRNHKDALTEAKFICQIKNRKTETS